MLENWDGSVLFHIEDSCVARDGEGLANKCKQQHGLSELRRCGKGHCKHPTKVLPGSD